MLILTLLSQHPTIRFGALKKEIDGISQKVLTQTLRHLERDGLIKRQVYDEMPLRVEYALTPLAKSLAPIINQFKQWTEKNMTEVISCNDKYDQHKNS